MKPLYLLIALGTITLFSCKKNIIDLAGHEDAESEKSSLSLHPKSCISQIFGNETVRLCFDSIISESRCPRNAVCVWQGTAVAQFSLSKNNVTYPFSLSTLHLQGLYSSDTTLAGYKIKFVDLTPYPQLFTPPVPENEIRAEVEITPL